MVSGVLTWNLGALRPKSEGGAWFKVQAVVGPTASTTATLTDTVTGTRPPGAAGILVEELSVRGIVLSNGTYVAMVSGPTKQTYSVRAGAKLLDGTVQSITPRAVVILQQVSDPLSLQKQREVRKLLRTQEEGK